MDNNDKFIKMLVKVLIVDVIGGSWFYMVIIQHHASGYWDNLMCSHWYIGVPLFIWMLVSVFAILLGTIGTLFSIIFLCAITTGSLSVKEVLDICDNSGGGDYSGM